MADIYLIRFGVRILMWPHTNYQVLKILLTATLRHVNKSSSSKVILQLCLNQLTTHK